MKSGDTVKHLVRKPTLPGSSEESASHRTAPTWRHRTLVNAMDYLNSDVLRLGHPGTYMNYIYIIHAGSMGCDFWATAFTRIARIAELVCTRE